jgi:intein-like protein with splicing domain
VTLAELEGRVDCSKAKPLKGGPGFVGRCPACARAGRDHKPPHHLSCYEGSDGWLHISCRYGCSEAEIMGALGLATKDRRIGPKDGRRPPPIAVHIYRNEDGAYVFEKPRMPSGVEPKCFFRVRAETGGYRSDGVQSLNGQVASALYMLPELLAAIRRGETVILGEGEKPGDWLKSHGSTLVATCGPYGADERASKWTASQTARFRGADVLIVADRDDVGEKYAQALAAKLSGVCKRVRVVQSKTTGARDDAYDHFAAGFGVGDFVPRPDLEPGRSTAQPEAPAKRGAALRRVGDHPPVIVRHVLPPYLPMASTVLVSGHGGCVAAETLLDTVDGPRRIDDLASAGKPIKVFALGPDGKAVVAHASCPFRKGRKPLYTYEFEDGLTITGTDDHRFLTPQGWEFGGNLRPGDAVAVFPQPRSDFSMGGPSVASAEYPRGSVASAESPGEYALVPSLEPGPEAVLCASSDAVYRRVSAVRYVRDDWFFDLEVPGYENYLAQGIWNHNTKKTFLFVCLAAALSNGFDPIAGTKLDRPYRTLILHKGGSESDPGSGDNTDEKLNTIYRANGGLGELLCAEVDRLDDAGCSLLAETIIDERIDLVVIDYLFLFTTGLIRNINDPIEAIPVCGRLLKLAKSTGCCIVAFRHTSKAKQGQDASEMGSGTNQWHDAMRGHLIFRKHPEEPHRSRGVVVVTDEKGDLLNIQGDPIIFSRAGNEVRFERSTPNPFEEPGAEKRPDLKKIGQAKELLRRLLPGQLVTVAIIREAAERAGIGWRSIERAKAELGATHTNTGYTDREYRWTMPVETDAGPYNPYDDE